MDDKPEPLGFKELTLENWLQPDSIMASGFFSKLFPESGEIRPSTSEDWVRDFLVPQLDPQVPLQVRRLFAVARGCLFYGWFFYPLYTLGIEQLYRVVDTAATLKAEELEYPEDRRKTLHARLEWFFEVGIIPRSDFVHWDALRNLRNLTSHPEYQEIQGPPNARHTLHQVADDINFLFAKRSPS